jgi:RNA polymerase sigma-70 factor (sigma-E family)
MATSRFACNLAGGRASLMVKEATVDAARVDEFTEFMLGRWSALVRFGYGLTGDRDLAEDLAQTALIRACAAWTRVRRADDPDAYIRKIMINSNRSWRRRRRLTELTSGLAPQDPGGGAGVADDDGGPELITALLSLPAGQRAVLVLRYWMDLSEAETAATLGCSVGNVKSQAARGLAKLRLRPELAGQAQPEWRGNDHR